MKPAKIISKIKRSFWYCVRWLIEKIKHPKYDEIYRCPYCHYRVDKIIKEMARDDFLCPRCNGIRLSGFTKMQEVR